jgi:hypothetical protein
MPPLRLLGNKYRPFQQQHLQSSLQNQGRRLIGGFIGCFISVGYSSGTTFCLKGGTS